MDLIDRAAAIEEVDYTVTSVSVCATVEQARGATWAKGRIHERLEKMPTIEAVPLDKLCEWLERYASMKCYGCIEAFRSCEDEENQEVSVCNSRERWKAMLTKWMEGQHET